MGGDKKIPEDWANLLIFQSTPPVWGATERQSASAYDMDISIHAPRVGGDDYLKRGWNVYSTISIHAPRVGGDIEKLGILADFYISIHAPRVGGDLFELHEHQNKTDFNPRPPCGGRRQMYLDKPIHSTISIHAPRVGGDIGTASRLNLFLIFQSTPPVWGATGIMIVWSTNIVVFQSTPPVWGATS